MKNTFYKLVIFSLIVILMLNVSNAAGIREYFAKSTAHDLDFTNLKNTIFSILRYIGYSAAVCVTLGVGVQFLTSNTQKRAMLKEKLWLIVLGVFILAAGIPLLQLIAKVIENMAKTIGKDIS